MYTITNSFSSGGVGSEFEVGDDKTIGGGYRLNFNPFDTIDSYSFNSQNDGMKTQKYERGIYVNSGMLQIVLFAVVVLGPEISIAAEPAIGVIGLASLLLFIKDSIISNNACELGVS